jgi:hypothetical protein
MKLNSTIVLFSYDATGPNWIFPSQCNETFGAFLKKNYSEYVYFCFFSTVNVKTFSALNHTTRAYG